jgi:hypothetical protein
MNWRSQLVARIRDMSKPGASPDSALRDNLFKAVDAVDNTIGRATQTPEIARDYAAARQQWKLLQSVEGAINPDGNVSPIRFHNALKKADPVGYARGQNQSPIYDMTRFLASTMGTPLVNRGSPTATRQVFNEAVSGNLTLTGLGAKALGGLAGRAVGGVYGMVGPANAQALAAYSKALGEAQATEAAKRAGGVMGQAAAGLVP